MIKKFYEDEDVYNQFLIATYNGTPEFEVAESDDDEVWVVVEEKAPAVGRIIIFDDEYGGNIYDVEFCTETGCIEMLRIAYDMISPAYTDALVSFEGGVISDDDEYYEEEEDESPVLCLDEQIQEIEDREEELLDATEQYLNDIAWGWEEILGADEASQLVADLTDTACQFLAESYGIAVYRPKFEGEKYIESPYQNAGK